MRMETSTVLMVHSSGQPTMVVPVVTLPGQSTKRISYVDDGDEWKRFVDDSDPDTGNSGLPLSLRLRGGGPPLIAEPAEPDDEFDAEFDVKAWQRYG